MPFCCSKSLFLSVRMMLTIVLQPKVFQPQQRLGRGCTISSLGHRNHLFWLQLQAWVFQRLPHLNIGCTLLQLQVPLLVCHQDDADAGLAAQSLPATAKIQQSLHKIFIGPRESLVLAPALGPLSLTLSKLIFLPTNADSNNSLEGKGSVSHSKN